MSYGGPPRTVYELSKALVKRGHEVTVFTTNAFNQNSTIDETNSPVYIDGIKVYYFKNLSNNLAWNHQLFISIGMIKAINNKMKTFDIVHLNMYRTFQNIIVHHYAKKYGIPYVISARGSIPRILQKSGLKKVYDFFWGYQILKHAKKVIGISKMETNQYLAMGVPSEKIITTYNGIDIENYKDLPPRGLFQSILGLNDAKIVLYLGRIHARKGLDFLIKSFSKLVTDKTDICLLLVGPDDGFQYILEKQVTTLGIADKVRFCGYLGYPEKIEAYVDADIVVYPAVHEYFGLVPFEALLCETPVIVTKESGCGEIISEADVGYLIDYNDFNGLTKAMKKILENSKLAKNKAKNGRIFTLENLNWNRIAEKTERVYSSAITDSER